MKKAGKDMFELIQIKEYEGIVIATILEKKSAKWDVRLIKELHDFVEQIRRNSRIQVIIFVREKQENRYAEEIRRPFLSPAIYTKLKEDLFHAIETLNVPTIAVMEGGVAVDYLEFSFMCDFRLTAEDTQLNFCFENGERPSYAGIKKISQMIGEMRTKELFFTSKILSTRSAVQIGLVNGIAEPERLMAESIEFAKCIKLTGTDMVNYVKGAFEVR